MTAIMVNGDTVTAQQYEIMIVDDDMMYSEVLKKVVSSEGYRTPMANSGIQAIELLQQNIPDLIFHDLFMPNLDGVATTKQIRLLPNLQKMP